MTTNPNTNGANTYLPGQIVIPTFLVIGNISNSRAATVTVTTPNSYIVGQLVYFSVPFTYGMYQINSLTGQIIAVDSTNLLLTVNIDSTKFDPFITPAFRAEQPATLSPAGSKNIYNFTTVPFHSLNGQVGN